ncbi:MAG: acyl-CoA thioesterase [Fidelibacterota bacterium]
MFVFQKKVRFSEVDAAGVVFFARAIEYFHMAYEDFMTSIGLDLHQQFIKAGTALPVVHVEADYKRAMKLGEVLDVHVAVGAVGTRSYTMKYKIIGQDGSLRVTGETKNVFVDADFKSATIPESMKQKIKAYIC